MRISYEAVYEWIYKDTLSGGLLYKYLIRCHKKRKKHRLYVSLRGLIPNRIDISLRPKIVAQRGRYGDWEGDTMVGYKHQGGIVIHVERKSRYLLASLIKNGTSELFNKSSRKPSYYSYL